MHLMSKKLGIAFDESQVEALDEIQKEGKADSYSEAGRIAANVGLQEMGYTNGQKSETALRSVVYRLSWLFSIAGMVGLGFTFAWPVPARIPSFAVLVFGIVLYGVSEILESHEPAISKKLKSLLGRDPA